MKWLLGPELLWAAVYGIAHALSARNIPPTPAGNALLERLWWLIPLLAVPTSFAALAVPGANRWVVLARIVGIGLVGVIAAATRVTGAVDYGDTRNSGTGAGWFVSILLGVVLLGIGGVATAVWLLVSKKGG